MKTTIYKFNGIKFIGLSAPRLDSFAWEKDVYVMPAISVPADGHKYLLYWDSPHSPYNSRKTPTHVERIIY